MGKQKEVIIITDGDKMASAAVEKAGRKLNLRTISASMGNPTPLKGYELVDLIKQSPEYPVLVMVDDCGDPGKGIGEENLQYLVNHPDLKVLGVVAVASNLSSANGTKVDFSVNSACEIVNGPVDKEGTLELQGHKYVEGDTVDVLNEIQVPLVAGIGDIGKMNGSDSVERGACVTVKAIKAILSRSGVYEATH